jgi:hypothetical protein
MLRRGRVFRYIIDIGGMYASSIHLSLSIHLSYLPLMLSLSVCVGVALGVVLCVVVAGLSCVLGLYGRGGERPPKPGLEVIGVRDTYTRRYIYKKIDLYTSEELEISG